MFESRKPSKERNWAYRQWWGRFQRLEALHLKLQLWAAMKKRHERLPPWWQRYWRCNQLVNFLLLNQRFDASMLNLINPSDAVLTVWSRRQIKAYFEPHVSVCVSLHNESGNKMPSSEERFCCSHMRCWWSCFTRLYVTISSLYHHGAFFSFLEYRIGKGDDWNRL